MAGAAGKRDDEIVSLNRQVKWLTQLMKVQRFGASSEQTQVLLEQFFLFNETGTLANSEAAEPDLEHITYMRWKPKGKRELDFSGMPAEQIIHKLLVDEQVCQECS